MSESFDRRRLIALLGAGLGVAALDSTESSAATGEQRQLRKLQNLLQLLERAGDHLGDISVGWDVPTDPDIPPTAAVLNSISAECTALLGIVNALLATLQPR